MKAALAVPLSLLCACTAPPDTPALSLQGCRAAEYSALVGAPLAAVTLPADLNDRVVVEGEPVGPVDPGRLTIFTTPEGIITRLRCG